MVADKMSFAESGIARRIFAELEAEASRHAVRHVVVGIVYTVVQLDNAATGLALSLRPPGCQGGGRTFDGMGPLTELRADVLLRGLLAKDPIERAVGLACANALANRAGLDYRDGDVRTGINVQADDRVAMIGHFRPLVKDLRQQAKDLFIFDLVDQKQGEVRPAAEAEQILPTCDVALITATSIINHSIDQVLDWASNCRDVVILGASTPMMAQVFAGTRVGSLSGVLVKNPDAVIQVVSEAGGMGRFKEFLHKVNLDIQAPLGDG